MKLKLLDEDEKLVSRRIEIKVSGKIAKTPLKAIELVFNKRTSPAFLLPREKVHGIIEFRIRFSQEMIEKIDKDERRMSKEISRIQQKLTNVKDNIIILLPTYSLKEERITREEIELLVSLLLSLWRRNIVDLIAIPILQIRVKRNIFKFPELSLYKEKFLIPFLKEVFSYNGEKLANCMLGYIPKISHRQVPKIIETYYKHSITNFVVEFNSSTPINYSPVLERILKSVKIIEREIKREGTLLHGININKGLGRREIDKIAAKDILAFCQGITSFSFPFKPAMQETQEPVLRIFERSDYGYYKCSKNELKILVEKETIKPLNNLKDLEKALNTKRILEETENIKNALKENRLSSYLASKSAIQTYLRRLQKFSQKIKVSSLKRFIE